MVNPVRRRTARAPQESSLLRWLVGFVLITSVSRSSAEEGVIGFEEMRSGPLLKQTNASGTWQAETGHATIHTQHKRSGQQCLRLHGGERRQVVWTLLGSAKKADTLDLWFERWTRRQPFDFRIEAQVSGKWQTLHHDTQKAVIGSFRNRLSLPLPSPLPTKIRFTSTTPKTSGVMIDDIELSKSGPMKIASIANSYEVAPALIRNEINSILDIQIVTRGTEQPMTASEFTISLNGTTNLDDVEHVELLSAGLSVPDWRDIEARPDQLVRFGKRTSSASRLTFRGKQLLSRGVNHFFVSVKLKPTASLAHRVAANCVAVTVDENARQPVEVPAIRQRIGYAVRKANDSGSKAYRIPGLATTKKGTLIAVYDNRYRGWKDLPHDIDVGMSRSTDGGQTWEPMRVIMNMGDDPNWHYDGVGDPSILVDQTSGTIWVAATWSHGNRSWVGSGPGLEPHETGQLMLSRSDDDGKTWSKPINITKQVKKPEWSFILQGPGRGITMRDGTLVFPAQYQDPPAQDRAPHSTIIYSKDHGKTWKCGTSAFDQTTEAAVVEIKPGALMLNCRYNLSNRRVVMITEDLGETWTEHPTSRKTLPEPIACMGSLVGPVTMRGKSNTDDQSLLFFSNPNADAAPRRRMSIKASSDRGMTWPAHWHTLVDAGNSAGYSCLTMVDDKHVGLLFEGSRSHMSFLRIPISELTRVPDKFNARIDETKEEKLQLGRVFQDHMALQREMPIAIWGRGKIGSTVTVKFLAESRTTVVDANQNWQLTLAKQQAESCPQTLTITSNGETLRIRDIVQRAADDKIRRRGSQIH